MQITEGLSMLEIAMTPRKGMIYPTLIWDQNNVILVDTGMPGQLQKIHEAIKNEEVPFERLNKVIITHQDLDHTGGLYDILKESKNKIEVLSHEDDKPYIQGEKPLVRLNSNFMNIIPENQRKLTKLMFENYSPVNVNKTLKDNEKLPYCGGMTITHTPGHTPGHICIYHQKSKTLIAGDAMNVRDGQLFGPRKEILDEKSYNLAMDSLKKLRKFDIKNIISYHGGFFNNNPNQKIKELL
jgi:glyoxylase-like metal-dependent hydrolase (beta-lactamase superfamily II)